MDDLASKLQELLNTQEGQENVKRVIEMLGADNSGNGPDLSSLANLLNNQPSQKEEKPKEAEKSNSIDLSTLTKLLNNQQSDKENSSSSDLNSMLSTLTNALNGNKSSDGPDLSALAGLLGNQQNSSSSENDSSENSEGFGGLDMNMLMKIQKLLSSTPKNDKNTALLRALKPHLRKERQKRADDAIRMMQLISMLPLLKDSGLFGGG